MTCIKIGRFYLGEGYDNGRRTGNPILAMECKEKTEAISAIKLQKNDDTRNI
jgi:hypothetical protein